MKLTNYYNESLIDINNNINIKHIYNKYNICSYCNKGTIEEINHNNTNYIYYECNYCGYKEG